MRRRGFLIPIFLWAVFAGEELRAQGPAAPAGFPEGSAEDVAMRAAAKFLEDENFILRQEFKKGEIGPGAGKGIRLQLFSKTEYRIFFAVPKGSLPKGAKLDARIVDRESKVVASAKSKFRSTVAVLEFTPEKTGLYMVLMRIDAPEAQQNAAKVPYAFLYGYK